VAKRPLHGGVTEKRLPSCSKGGHFYCAGYCDVALYVAIIMRCLDFWRGYWFSGVGSYDCDSWYVQVMMLFHLVPSGSSSLSDIN